MPQFDFVHELIPKLKQGMITDSKTQEIIQFDNNQYLKGIEFLGTLHSSILYKKVLEINYQPYESQTSIQFIIHPYYLKQYNNRWFLFGLNDENKKPDWNLPLDRILSIKETKNKYVENKKINWQEYFEDIVGVTKIEDKRPENIVLHFFGKTIHYIVTKPLHGSQKSKLINENTLEVRLNVIVNFELERLIISYSENVKVIAPMHLAKSIKSKLQNSIIQYEN
jgi:predicted DNA-binding transcriptional regulator YafY